MHKNLTNIKFYLLILIHFFGISSIKELIKSKDILLIQLILLIYVGISATSGSHRLFTHNTYEATFFLRIFYLLGGILGGTGSPIGWIKSHRTHHQYTDTDLDPHNSKRGFWYSHFGWTFTQLSDEIELLRNNQNINTLLNLNLHKFIDKNYKILFVLLNILLPNILFYIKNKKMNKKIFHKINMTSLTRIIIGLNMAASVNSIAHKFGTRPHNKNISAFNNLLVSLFTWGEGWHNYHHAYPKDYRASNHKNFILFWNPAHLFILLMAYFKQAYNLKVKCDKNDKGNKIVINGEYYKYLFYKKI